MLDRFKKVKNRVVYITRYLENKFKTDQARDRETPRQVVTGKPHSSEEAGHKKKTKADILDYRRKKLGGYPLKQTTPKKSEVPYVPVPFDETLATAMLNALRTHHVQMSSEIQKLSCTSRGKMLTSMIARIGASSTTVTL